MKLSVKIRLKDKSVFGTLSEMAEAMSRSERSLYRCLFDDSDYAKYKPAFCRQHGITSRQFNSLRMSVEGRLEARKSSLDREHDKVAAKLAGAIRVIDRIEAELKSGVKTKQNAFVLHQKKRLRHSLELRIKDLAADIKDGARRLCFGGRKLFNAQHHLEENGFADHAQWLAAWRASRNSQFLVVGSTKESFGNQSCQLIMDAVGKGFLSLRLTNSMESQTGSSHLKIPLQVSYHAEYLRAAITRDQPIAWRFVHESAGRWYAIATVEVQPAELTTTRAAGCVGIDLNDRHIAVAVIDRFGNPVEKRTIPMDLRDMAADKRLSLVRQAVAIIIALCQDLHVPLAHEILNFSKKKLKNNGKRHNELLHRVPTAMLAQVIASACLRGGVEQLPVSPAYTSMIGVKYTGYGYSGHHGAAVVIARRAIGFSCDKKGERVAFRDPASHAEGFIIKRGEHRFSAWRRHHTRLGDLKRKAQVAPQAKDTQNFIQEPGSRRAPEICLRQREVTRNRVTADKATNLEG